MMVVPLILTRAIVLWPMASRMFAKNFLAVATTNRLAAVQRAIVLMKAFTVHIMIACLIQTNAIL
jgi:hypothetical protein